MRGEQLLQVIEDHLVFAKVGVRDGEREPHGRHRRGLRLVHQLELRAPVSLGAAAPERLPHLIAVEHESPATLSRDQLGSVVIPSEQLI